MAEPSAANPLLLGCFFAALLGLLVSSLWGGLHPVFLAKPPITRRSNFFEVPHGNSCPEAIQEGAWTDWPLPLSCDRQGYATCGDIVARRWKFSPQAVECGARRLDRKEIQELLGGKWVVFAGDSVVRMLYAALLRATGSKGREVKYKHQDFEYKLEGNIHATFLWRAFAPNVTALYNEWRSSKTTPDLVVSSVSLWHLLHVTNASAFSSELGKLGEAARAYLREVGPRPRLLLGSTTDTFTNRQPTEKKRKNMTPKNVDAYNQALVDRSVAGPKGPFGLLDLFALTRGCGEECSVDGIHSVESVYDTALQLILNVFRLPPA